MDLFPKETETLIHQVSAQLLKELSPQLTPTLRSMIPLDLDVSPFDFSGTKKEGVSNTYNNADGYAPTFSYF